MAATSPETIYATPFTVVGVNHKTLPVEGREVLASLHRKSELGLAQIAGNLGLKEAALLSTCNRFELISVGGGNAERLSEFLKEQLKSAGLEPGIYAYQNKDALRHVFRVASSLDSMVVGEAQILGQVKDAYSTSVDLGLAGRRLHHLFQFSFRLAKKIRENTGIAEKGVSISYVAVKLAEQIFGDLDSRTVLIIGSGKMAELAALHLKSYGCSNVIVANRTLERASELAGRIGGSAIALSEISHYLEQVDVVISSISSDRPILETAQVRKSRRNKTLFMIDLGMPRNLSPALGELDNVYLYNIDDLSGIADENRALREEAAREAEIIVEYGLAQFERWLNKLVTEPTLLDLRAKVAEVCERELQKSLKSILPAQQLTEILPQLTYKISQRISHGLSDAIAGRPDCKIDESVILPLVFDEFLTLK